MELNSHNLVDMNEFKGIKYEKKPAKDEQGNPVEGIYNAWIWLDNPTQFNSYRGEFR